MKLFDPSAEDAAKEYLIVAQEKYGRLVNNTSPGEAVYEPFLGSGTTLIAAESVGRLCFAVELSPNYVDVAVRRWQAFTGRNALRLSDGRNFDEIASTTETD